MKKFMLGLMVMVSLLVFEGKDVYNMGRAYAEEKLEEMSKDWVYNRCDELREDDRVERVVMGRSLDGKLKVIVDYKDAPKYSIKGDTYGELERTMRAWLD